MGKLLKNDRGMVIVEATFVFPIMFFILFFLIYMGNGYYQKAKIDNYVTLYALQGAADCADPLLDDIRSAGSVPTNNSDIQPYRYFIGGMNSVENTIKTELKKKITGSGFFAGMDAKIKTCEVQYTNQILYSTFSVEVSYVVEFPIKFLGDDKIQLLKLNSRAEVPVTDVSDFIRNTDMAIDYLESSEVVQDGLTNIKNAISKVKEFLGF